MVDIAVVLQSITASMNIARAVAEAQTEFNRADLKLKMADVMSTLADARIALSEARETIHERDQTIKGLQDKITAHASGAACPKCNEGRIKLTGSRPHPTFGDLGVLERTYECDQCGFTENVMHEPGGLTKAR